jgi:hypothetical protein
VRLDKIDIGVVRHNSTQDLVSQLQRKVYVVQVDLAPRDHMIGLRDRVTHPEPVDLVDVQRLRSVRKVVRQENPHPRIAGLGIGGQPYDAFLHFNLSETIGTGL